MSKHRKHKTDEQVLGRTTIAALAQQITPVAPPPQRVSALRERVLARIHETPQEPHQGLLTIHAQEGTWRKIGPGVQMKELYVDQARKTRSFLLRLQPGASLPAHEHHADEECVVLEGEASLGGIKVRAGDYHLAPKGVPHGVVSSETGALLFLRGEMSSSAGWLYKMLKHSVQEFMGSDRS